MSMEANMSDFIPGDIVELYGETYQVLENRGSTGLLIPFPSKEIPPEEVAWDSEKVPYTKIGHAQLPGPTPCATADGDCPTDGKGEPPEIAINIDLLRK
jgi:hypothetical protein